MATCRVSGWGTGAATNMHKMFYEGVAVVEGVVAETAVAVVGVNNDSSTNKTSALQKGCSAGISSTAQSTPMRRPVHRNEEHMYCCVQHAECGAEFPHIRMYYTTSPFGKQRANIQAVRVKTSASCRAAHMYDTPRVLDAG